MRRHLMIAAALLTLPVAAPATALADEATQPAIARPWVVQGSIADIAPVPGTDQLIAIKNSRVGHNDPKVGVYTPGEGWSVTDLPTYDVIPQLTDVAMVSADDGWIAASLGRDYQSALYHWDGESWQLQQPDVLQGCVISDLSVAASDSVWASADCDATDHSTEVIRWDGSGWTRALSRPDNYPDSSAQLLSVAAAASEDVWALGDGADNKPLALHWTGGDWRRVSVPFQAGDSDAPSLSGGAASGPDNVWSLLGGYLQLLAHWDGSRWTQQPHPEGMPRRLPANGISTSSDGSAWIIANPWQEQLVYRVDDDGSAEVSPPRVCGTGGWVYLYDITALADDDVYATGACEFSHYGNSKPYTLALRYDGTGWSRI